MHGRKGDISRLKQVLLRRSDADIRSRQDRRCRHSSSGYSSASTLTQTTYWNAAGWPNIAVRSWLKKELGISAYVVSAVVFPTMEPDDSILAAAASRSTRVQLGMAAHVERLAALPGEQALQHPLQGRYIPDDAEALSRQPDATAAEPETASLDVGDDRVVIHAGAVHVHLTIMAAPNDGGNDGDACSP